jgi:hypothetical protein
LNLSQGLGAALIGLGGGLIVGLLVGALLLASDDGSTAAVITTESPNPRRTPTPEPTEKPEPAPTESPDWEPCDKPGLCAFLETLDERLAATDVDGVMELIEFVPNQCRAPGTELLQGTFPIECRDWPYDDPVPTAGFAALDSQGVPTSRWAIRETLEAFIEGRETDCAGETGRIERRLRVVVKPPSASQYWSGEVTLLLGAPLDCQPVIDPDSGQRFVFAVRPNESGVWQIEAVLEVAFDHCAHSVYNFGGDIRYYPLDAGPPRIQGLPVCKED